MEQVGMESVAWLAAMFLLALAWVKRPHGGPPSRLEGPSHKGRPLVARQPQDPDYPLHRRAQDDVGGEG
jgi:hypothetical protein